MQLLTNLFNYMSLWVSGDTTPELYPFDLRTLRLCTWYERLEMVARLAEQVSALHASNKVHRTISIAQVFVNSNGQLVLGKSREEAFDRDVQDRHESVSGVKDFLAPERLQEHYRGSYKPADVYASGYLFYLLLFFEEPPWKDGSLLREMELKQTLLSELDLLSDIDAAKGLFFWMCHPDVQKRADITTACRLLKDILDDGLPSLSAYSPQEVPENMPANLLTRDPAEIVQIVKTLFENCPEGGPYYIPRKRSGLDQLIIYLKDRILLLPKQHPNREERTFGSDKCAREITLLEKEPSGWKMHHLFALTTKKNSSSHVFKSVARKERALHALFKDRGILPKHILSLSFADKPDKILCVYEKAIDLFNLIKTGSTLDFKRGLPLACRIIDAVDVLLKEGFVHRDIKLENILVGPNDSILLCDLDSCVKDIIWQHFSERVGTPEFIPPERHDRSYTGSWVEQVIYSVGCTLFFLTHNKLLPWDRENCMNTMDGILKAKHEYEPTAENARKSLQDSKKLPRLSSDELAKELTSWMVHPDKNLRTPWNKVIEINRILKIKLGIKG